MFELLHMYIFIEVLRGAMKICEVQKGALAKIVFLHRGGGVEMF